MVADRAPLVRHSCATALPVPLSAGLSLLSLTCLLEPWSLVRRLSAARLPLVHLIVHRYSSAPSARCSVCLSITGPSLVCLLARRCSSVADTLLVCLLVHHWLSLSCTCSWSLVCLLVRLLPSPRPSPRPSLVAGPSLVCRWSITGPSPRPSLVTGRSARVRVAAPWLVCCSSVTYPWLVMVARASARSSRVALQLLRLLVHHWPVCCSLLSCLLFVHRSVCSSHGRWLVARPSAARRCSVYWSRNWPVPGLSARSSLVHLITHRSSVYSSLTGLSTRLSRVCLLVSHGSVYSSRGHGSYRWSVCSLVTGPWVRVMSLVRLFESWSLVCILDSSLAFSCVAGLPLVR